MTRIVRTLVALSLLTAGGIAADVRTVFAADGQMVWAVHVTLAPRWLDPGETEVGHHAVHGPLRHPRRAA